MNKLYGLEVLVRGGGEVASAVAHRLHRSHFKVCLTEVAGPLAVCRGVCYSEAIFDGTKTIEGVMAERVAASIEEIRRVWQKGNIPIAIDPQASIKEELSPDVLIDAIMLKRKPGTTIHDAPLVIGLGPGFYAGRDAHLVVETNNSNSMGMVITEGETEINTGTPLSIGGLTSERVLWAEQDGVVKSDREIGETVRSGEPVGTLGDRQLNAPLDGIIRGLVRDNVRVTTGAKLVEIDPVNDRSVCYTIRDKMRAIAGGVLEAIMLVYNVRDE
jgi:xanthine dehydrogenase accessory factor